MVEEGYCTCIKRDSKTVYLYDGYFEMGAHKYIGIDAGEKELIDILVNEYGDIRTIDNEFKNFLDNHTEKEIEEKRIIDFGDSSFTTSSIDSLIDMLKYGNPYNDTSIIVYGTSEELKENSIRQFNVDKVGDIFYIADLMSIESEPKSNVSSIRNRAFLLGGD